MAEKDRKLSVKHALTAKQVQFCEQVHASGGVGYGRAYKAAYAIYRETDGKWVTIQDEDIDIDAVSPKHRAELIAAGTPVETRTMDHRGMDMVRKNKLVMAYLAELNASDRDMANAVLREQLVKGSVAERRKAAELQRSDQGRQDFSSAVDSFWQLSAEVGATVTRAYPGELRKLVVCPCGCNHEHEVVLPIHDRFPVGVVPPNGIVEMTLSDIRTGVCWIEYDTPAKMELLRRAGAPWSEVDPEAKLANHQVEWYEHHERVKLLHGGSGAGKLLHPETIILTPKGLRAYRELQVGDEVFDEQGQVCRVTGLSPEWTEGDWYELEFDTGERIVCHERHEWVTHPFRYRKALARRKGTGPYAKNKATRAYKTPKKQTCEYAERQQCRPRLGPETLETRDIVVSMVDNHGGSNHAIPVCGALEMPAQELPIDPWLLGVWLGDGTSRSGQITCADPETIERIRALGYEVRKNAGKYTWCVAGLMPQLRALGLLQNKHVPTVYQIASREQRLALIQGLMDTDGTIGKRGGCQFTNSNPYLSHSLAGLLRSLGIKVFETVKPTSCRGKRCKDAYLVSFTTDQPVFRLAYKLARLPKTLRQTQRYHYVVGARAVRPSRGRCIEVDSPSHLYLAGRALIPTHNSVLGAGDCIIALMIPGQVVAVIGAQYENCEKEFRYIDQGMRKLFPNLSAFRRIACISRLNYHDLECSPIWGSECFAYSMEFNDGKSALGETIHHATISEAAQVGIAMLNKRVIRALDRALMKRPGYPFARETGTLTLPTTPDEHRGTGCSSEILKARKKLTKNDLSKLRYGRTRFEETFYFREASVLENPAYNTDVFAANKATMKAHEFEEIYEGKMTSATGRVYHQYSETKHLRAMPSREIRQGMRFSLGIDTGAYFAANLVGITPERDLWVLGEAHEEKETTKVQAASVGEMILRVLPYDFRGDVARALARIDLHIIDPSSPFKLDLEEYLPGLHYESPSRNHGKFDLMPTISQMGELFTAQKLFIVDECDYTLEELDRYIWKSQRSPARQGVYMVREPARDHDHHMDATRMGVIPLWELGPLAQAAPEGSLDWYQQTAMDRVHNPLREIMRRAERSQPRWH